jgi:hypothetical protein
MTETRWIRVIYDLSGHILVRDETGSGFVPDGVPYQDVPLYDDRTWVDHMDMSTTPARPVFQYYPKSQQALTAERLDALENTTMLIMAKIGGIL